MAKNKNKKQKVENKEKKKSNSQPVNEKPEISQARISDSADSDSDSLPESERIHKLLEPYSKNQLIDFLSDAALSDGALLEQIRSTADHDISHRKIFVHGLGWDTTSEALFSSFESYGDIEDCNVVVDKATGKAKGYGFVLFKTRAAAAKALKQPQKKIRNRPAFCQLASVGPGLPVDIAARRVYVNSVPTSADPDKLRTFFARFGEIESGPLGFDPATGKSRGFALFVYKTAEGAKMALEEPYKVFGGHRMLCQRADSTQKARAASSTATTTQQQLPGPAALAAAAAAQNLALFAQNPSLNPAFSALFANPSAGLLGTDPLAAASSGSTGLGAYGLSQHGLGGLGGGTSVLGAYGIQAPTAAMLGLQSFPGAQLGQSSTGRAYGAGGSLSGIPPFIW